MLFLISLVCCALLIFFWGTVECFPFLSCFWRYFWSAIIFLIKRFTGIQLERPRNDWNQEEHIRKLLFVFFFVHRSEHPWICGRCVMDTGGVCFLPIGTQTIKLTNSSTAVSSCITWIPVAPVFLSHWRNWVQWIGFSILQDAVIQFLESLHKNKINTGTGPFLHKM